MQLLLVVIYVLAQILGNGGSADSSAPASGRSRDLFMHPVITPDCTPDSFNPSPTRYQEVGFPADGSERSRGKQQPCRFGADNNPRTITTMEGNFTKRPQMAVLNT